MFNRRLLPLTVAVLLLLAGTAASNADDEPPVIVWEGQIQLEAAFEVPEDRTLIVRAGTSVAGPGAVVVHGDLRVMGRPSAPVVWQAPVEVDGPGPASLQVVSTHFPGQMRSLSDPRCTILLDKAKATIERSTFSNHSTAVCASHGSELLFHANEVRHSGFRIVERDHLPGPVPTTCEPDPCPEEPTRQPLLGQPGEHDACWSVPGDLWACRGWGGTRALEVLSEGRAVLSDNRFVSNHVGIYVSSTDVTVSGNVFEDNDRGIWINTRDWNAKESEHSDRPLVVVGANTFRNHGSPDTWTQGSVGDPAGIWVSISETPGPRPPIEHVKPPAGPAAIEILNNTLSANAVAIHTEGYVAKLAVKENRLMDNGIGFRGSSASAVVWNNTLANEDWDIYLDGHTGWVQLHGADQNTTKIHVAGEQVLETPWGLIVGAGAGLSLLGLLAALTQPGRYLFLRFAVPLFSRLNRSELLDHETRSKLVDYIRENPGSHLRQLSRELDIPYSTVVYHLRRLDEGGVIEARTSLFKKRFYPTAAQRSTDSGLEGTRATIFHAVLDQPGSTCADLSEALNLSPQLISHHVRSLEEEGYLRRTNKGTSKPVYPDPSVYTDQERPSARRKHHGADGMPKEPAASPKNALARTDGRTQEGSD